MRAAWTLMVIACIHVVGINYYFGEGCFLLRLLAACLIKFMRAAEH